MQVIHLWVYKACLSHKVLTVMDQTTLLFEGQASVEVNSFGDVSKRICSNSDF